MKNLETLISLSGKTCMVTGAGDGIGIATAEILGSAGAKIYAVDIREDKLDKMKKDFSTKGIEIEVFKCDLSVKEEIDNLWQSLRNREPDILVNNVGIYPFRDFLEVDEEILDKTISVNLKSCFWMCQKMIKSNIKRGKGGIIVNVSSIEALIPFVEGLVHYTSSKAGVIAITRALAKEYSNKGFRINAILPGGIVTRGTKVSAKNAIIEFDVKKLISGIKFWNRLPSKRVGKPEDVGKVILAIVSDLFSYVYGAIIPVDGGFLVS
ncbi:MAG: SDR family oxidoreductase [Brevinematales bacterium]|nr:SDR family oxidoreductase [Brevinematales bacterium]